MGKRRGLKNKVYDVPEELRKQVNLLLLDGKTSLKQLKDLVNNYPDNNVEISYSGLNRYAKAFDKEMKDLSDLDHLLRNLPKDINFDDESKAHKLIAQILSKSILTFSMGKEDFDAKELSFVAKALKDIMSSTKDREKIKADLRKEIRAETLEKVEKVAEKAGISKSGIALIREALTEKV